MKQKQFLIPAEVMVDFAEFISELELQNEIGGKTEDDDIIINIFYGPEEREKVLEVVEWVDAIASDESNNI